MVLRDNMGKDGCLTMIHVYHFSAWLVESLKSNVQYVWLTLLWLILFIVGRSAFLLSSSLCWWMQCATYSTTRTVLSYLSVWLAMQYNVIQNWETDLHQLFAVDCDRGCQAGGQSYEVGETFSLNGDPCEQCLCQVNNWLIQYECTLANLHNIGRRSYLLLYSMSSTSLPWKHDSVWRRMLSYMCRRS